MSGSKPPKQEPSGNVISILLVDDIPEARENIKKLLAFETDFKVVGSAGTGKEAVELAIQLKPDIILTDINMPDMDGITATRLITEKVPQTAVIMMSVQNDTDYLRKAMLAGARNFLSKPIDMDELYNTIRTVYKGHEAMRRQVEALNQVPIAMQTPGKAASGEGDRAGHIIVVYSPQGGAGTTMVATNLASGLMKDGIKVLLVDADLQFGDIDVFLNLQAQSTIVDLVANVEDLDIAFFDNIVVTHNSGLKVLMGPPRPEFADDVRQHPKAPAEILRKVAGNYDFIIVDTNTALDDMVLELFDAASRILLVSTTTLPSVKNTRFVLDLFDQLGYSQDKVLLVLNKVWEENQRKNATLSPEKIQDYLKRSVFMKIPVIDERFVLSAVNRGVPVIASDRDTNKPLLRELTQLAENIHNLLNPPEDETPQPTPGKQKQVPMGGLFGRK
ncbi:MAG: response regulator [Anaerolineae bacterium]